LACGLLVQKALRMTSKIQNNSKTGLGKPVRKSRKGATETSRLFIHVEELIGRFQTGPLTRYIE
jgi:hypothetical protein